MDLIEALTKLKIVDVNLDVKTDIQAQQAGIINVKVENNTYTYPIIEPEAIQKLKEISTIEIEDLVRKEVQRQLAPIAPILKHLSDSTSSEIIATTAVNTLGIHSTFTKKSS